ncbi:hypothetical protein KR038_002727 [Drosophila bunnanda]|nr:hypothetical protein KR038_002727 [Drosophila bunnanda]
MAEPSESWLDWHFKTQLRTYMEEDLPAACPSDRVIMAKWLQVLKAAPVNQKMARNSLMLLMHGHLEDFGFLRAPFTDVNNCSKDLNQVVNRYHGISLLKPLKDARSRSNDKANKEPHRVAGGRSTYRSRSPRRVPSRTRLDTIAEVTEVSSAYSSEVNVAALRPSSTTVRQRIQAIERDLAMNTPTPLPNPSTRSNTHQSCRNEAKAASNNRYVNRPSPDPPSRNRKPRSGSPIAVRKLTPPLPVRSTQNIRKCTHHCLCHNTKTSCPDQLSQKWKPVSGCSSVVQKLKNCFQEVSERLKDPSKDDNPVLGRVRATALPPGSAKRTTQRCKCPSEEDFLSKTRLEGGQAIPMSYQRDKTVMDLLRRQEELRQQCLEYYNLDGTLKSASELPVPTSLPESKIEGFSIGACRAMERMKRWRGKPNQLKFFGTIFRGCGLESDVTGRVKALDRRFEVVALQWLRKKRRLQPGCNMDQKPTQSMQEVLEKKKAVKTEYMAHVAEIRKLCEILCRGVILPDVLDQMFHYLDIEYEAANGDVERLEDQLKDMMSSTC